jgi:hypothetical protein
MVVLVMSRLARGAVLTSGSALVVACHPARNACRLCYLNRGVMLLCANSRGR